MNTKNKTLLLLGSFALSMIALLGAFESTYSRGDRVAIFWDMMFGIYAEVWVFAGIIVGIVVLYWIVKFLIR